MKILVVDDDEDILNIMRILLADFEVYTAKNADEALKLCESLEFDIAIVDFLLPGKNGAELTRELLSLNPKLKVIGITAYAKMKESELISAGALKVLPKPFTRRDLLETIRRISTTSDPSFS
ncbi:MAG: response regulator [Archaeoglobaceae archaeon]